MIRFLLAVVLGLAGSAAFATEGPAQLQLTLKRVAEDVMQKNPAVLGAFETIKAQDAAVRAQWGAFLPHVAAVGQFGSQTQDATPSRHSHPTSQQIVVSQPITVGEEVANLSAAKATAHAAAADAAGTVQAVLLETVRAYTAVLQAEAVVSQTSQFVQAVETQKKVAEAQFKTGEATKTNVLQATARLMGARAELAQAQAVLVKARADMGALGAVVKDGDALVWPGVPALPATEPVQADVVRDNPQAVAARAREEALKARVWAAGTAGLPDVTATATAGRATETYTRYDEPVNARAVMVNVRVPIFQGGQVLAAWQGAKAAARAGRYAVNDVEDKVVAGMTTAWASWQAAEAALTAAEQALVAQQAATKGIRAEYKGGERSFTDWLDAEQALKQAYVQEATAKAGRLLAAYGVLAAQGRLVGDCVW